MGVFFLWLALAAGVFTFWNAYAAVQFESGKRGRKKDRTVLMQKKLRLGRLGFYSMTALVAMVSAYLLYLIFTHRFQYEYVYRYSSRDLSWGLLLSTFWAGQAGSFLLWALYTALMGVVFLRTAREWESHGMLFLTVVEGFFLILLLKAGPFVRQATIPADGVGLNPLLQNFWMVIHPPVLFLGYAAAAFPLVIALSALARKDFGSWEARALPWTLFTSITLGAGIMLGGYWAYGTLGWGGYWGWDPVENSSFVPWLVSFALFHGLIIEKTRGALKRANLLLAIFLFVLVLYATFLTRSGVLADFSVHSFQDLGLSSLLLLFLLLPIGLGLWLFIRRYDSVPVVPLGFGKLNRENLLFYSMLVLLGSAGVTLLGTSFPLLSRLFTEPSNVNASFYNQVNLPFAVTMGLLLGIAPLLKWGSHNHTHAGKKLLFSLLLTAISGSIAFLAGIQKPVLLLLVVSAAFALWTNLLVLVQQWRAGWKNIGGPLAHIGVALLCLGIVISGELDREQFVQLTRGIPARVLGHELVFEGTQPQPNGKDVLRIRVSSGTSGYVATPRLYFAEYNRSMMKEPFIETGWLRDLYISPVQRIEEPSASGRQTLTLREGETKTLARYRIRFVGFEMQQHGQNGAVKVGANLEISDDQQHFQVTPSVAVMGARRKVEPAALPIASADHQAPPTVVLMGIDATERSVRLGFDHLVDSADGTAVEVPEKVAVQVSIKPFMNILWLGTVLLTLGTAIALKRRVSGV